MRTLLTEVARSWRAADTERAGLQWRQVRTRDMPGCMPTPLWPLVRCPGIGLPETRMRRERRRSGGGMSPRNRREERRGARPWPPATKPSRLQEGVIWMLVERERRSPVLLDIVAEEARCLLRRPRRCCRELWSGRRHRVNIIAQVVVPSGRANMCKNGFGEHVLICYACGDG